MLYNYPWQTGELKRKKNYNTKNNHYVISLGMLIVKQKYFSKFKKLSRVTCNLTKIMRWVCDGS